MKKFLLVLIISIFGFSTMGCNSTNSSVVRIHIRANSNSESDQSVKLIVRDAVIDYITPLIADCGDAEDVKNTLSDNLSSIEDIADEVLDQNGFIYSSNAEVRNEYFPSRDYGGNTFPADYYDALILELGSGTGDNWWCVAYPPLCFVGENASGNSIKYKSKIVELINKYFG